jgi:hypothetical protein
MTLLLVLACTTPATTPTPDPSDRPGHVVRLTHLQWENSVDDLLNLKAPTPFSKSFVPDPAVSTFENDSAALSVSPVLWQQYQSAAETLAAQVVTDHDLYHYAVPQDLRPSHPAPGDDERDAWIAGFGARAFRRPLEPDEIAAFTRLFDSGKGLFGTGDPFMDGVRACIAAFLQSPGFLYRTEGVHGPAAATELSPDELASKLSYSLWNTMPDAELAAAAGDGTLPKQALVPEVARLLADPRGHAMVADLHRQLLHVDSYAQIWRPSEQVLGIDVYKDSAPASMQAEVYAFVDHVVYTGGTVRDLFTSSHTFIDDNLADIYDVPAPGGALVATDLDPGRRAGLLTLSGFLAWEASDSEPNLIERGAFVNRSILCVDVPPPPPTATPLPEDDGDSTLRERIEEHTSTCGAGCHTSFINPIGFAFGKYDEEGRFVDRDHGRDIDATGTYTFDDGTMSYDGAVELGGVLAARAQVHRCYVAHLLGYLEGRSPAEVDEARIEQLTAASLAGRPIRDLITDVVIDPAFRQVAP